MGISNYPSGSGEISRTTASFSFYTVIFYVLLVVVQGVGFEPSEQQSLWGKLDLRDKSTIVF